MVRKPRKTRGMDRVRQFVEDKLRERGLTKKQASIAMGRNETYLWQWLNRGKRESSLQEEDRIALAAVLGCTPDELRGPPRRRATQMTQAAPKLAPVALPGEGNLPRDVPIHGTDAVERGRFHMGEVVDHAKRPPALANTHGVYAIYVPDGSMEPRFEPGELVFIHPHRPPSPGCYALIALESGDAMLRRVVAVDNGTVTVRRLDTGAKEAIARTLIRHIHRALTNNELFGQ